MTRRRPTVTPKKAPTPTLTCAEGSLGYRFSRRGVGRVLSTTSQARVAQRIEHLTTDQKVRGSNPFVRTHVRHMKRRSKPLHHRKWRGFCVPAFEPCTNPRP